MATGREQSGAPPNLRYALVCATALHAALLCVTGIKRNAESGPSPDWTFDSALSVELPRQGFDEQPAPSPQKHRASNDSPGAPTQRHSAVGSARTRLTPPDDFASAPAPDIRADLAVVGSTGDGTEAHAPSRAMPSVVTPGTSEPAIAKLDVRSALEAHGNRSDGVVAQSDHFRGHGGLSRAYAINVDAARAPVVPGNTRFGSDKKGALRATLCFIPPDTPDLKQLGRCTPSAVLYADVLDIPWRRFTQGFPGVSARYSWFALDYRGHFSVRAGGDYLFRLFSMDGSILWIDGDKTVDNDGVHVDECPPTPDSHKLPCAIAKSRKLTLRSGRHSIRVLYYKAGARVGTLVPPTPALQLFVTPPGEREILWKPVI